MNLEDRPSFDSIWMDLAVALSKRSTCRRLKVGCVVVTSDNHRVLAIGYNGGAKGLFNECLSDEPGKCGHLHAEVNALLKANYSDAAERKLYVTTCPCFACSVAIVNSNVREVIYRDEYRDVSGVTLLTDAGIRTRRFP